MIDFLQSHIINVVSLPTIVIVGILGYLIIKLVVKTIIKVALLIILILLALIFWGTFQSFALSFVQNERIVDIINEQSGE
jgi:hypothetical protein